VICGASRCAQWSWTIRRSGVTATSWTGFPPSFPRPLIPSSGPHRRARPMQVEPRPGGLVVQQRRPPASQTGARARRRWWWPPSWSRSSGPFWLEPCSPPRCLAPANLCRADPAHRPAPHRIRGRLPTDHPRARCTRRRPGVRTSRRARSPENASLSAEGSGRRVDQANRRFRCS
jgi:hypothetical protein